jgi:uncharacterized protein YegJ (DUF2314 family)
MQFIRMVTAAGTTVAAIMAADTRAVGIIAAATLVIIQFMRARTARLAIEFERPTGDVSMKKHDPSPTCFALRIGLVAAVACWATLIVPVVTGADPTPAPAATPKRLISLVLLTNEARQHDHSAIAAAATAASGATFSEDAIQEKPPYHLVRLPSGEFLISHVATPYFPDVEKAAADIRDPAVSKAVKEHRAWLAVDWFANEEPKDIAATYAQIGKMVASLAGPETLAVYSPDLNDFRAYDNTTKQTLASAEPLAMFPKFVATAKPPTAAATSQAGSAAPPAEGVLIANDDARLKKARAEARKRWPEFVKAFNSKKEGQYFAVKGPFEESGNKEFMWLKVKELDNETVHGTLENEPKSLANWTREQDIHIKIANVDDWVYAGPDTKPVGAFTQQMFAEAAKQKSPAPQEQSPAEKK